VSIPSSVTTIGRDAFYRNKLTSVSLGANITVDGRAFNNGLVDFYIRNGKKAGIYRWDREWRYSAK
jgi:hypothetical protein